jgi:hypothetical protein
MNYPGSQASTEANGFAILHACEVISEFRAIILNQILIFTKEGSPYFPVFKNKCEEDAYEKQQSRINKIFSFVKNNFSLFLSMQK